MLPFGATFENPGGGIAMAYFVTGGTGFIGRFLVQNLLKRGEPVYALVRKSSQKKLDLLRESGARAGAPIPTASAPGSAP